MENSFRLNRANGRLLGVCAGIADYAGMDAFLIRLMTVLLVLAGFGLTIPLYFAAYLLADK